MAHTLLAPLQLGLLSACLRCVLLFTGHSPCHMSSHFHLYLLWLLISLCLQCKDRLKKKTQTILELIAQNKHGHLTLQFGSYRNFCGLPLFWPLSHVHLLLQEHWPFSVPVLSELLPAMWLLYMLFLQSGMLFPPSLQSATFSSSFNPLLKCQLLGLQL